MLQIIYASAETEPFTAANLEALLAKARIKNARLGVSGMLLYEGGSFLQVLEGEPEVTAALFRQIEADPRHGRVIKLHETTIASRQFEGWSMGFASVDALRGSPGYSPILEHDFPISSFLGGRSVSLAHGMLLGFREGRLRRHVRT